MMIREVYNLKEVKLTAEETDRIKELVAKYVEEKENWQGLKFFESTYPNYSRYSSDYNIVLEDTMLAYINKKRREVLKTIKHPDGTIQFPRKTCQYFTDEELKQIEDCNNVEISLTGCIWVYKK